tara:strand:+ start:15158 stop:15478 length:321 start_codon:yes stop_codon:yes gene_type:complete
MADKEIHLHGATASEHGSDELHLAGSPKVAGLATLLQDNVAALSASTFAVRPEQVLALTTDVNNNVVMTVIHSRGTKKVILSNKTVAAVTEIINRSELDGNDILAR